MTKSRTCNNYLPPPWTMGDWKTIAEKVKELLKSKKLTAAKEELATGLEKFPNQLNLLTIANDVYRASGDREKSLEYSELLITHHSDKWQGYGLAAQDLVALNRFEEAQEKIQAGLEKIPNQLNLFTIAADIYFDNGNLEKSLEYADLLITHHPDDINGYSKLIELGYRDESIELAQKRLEANPDNNHLSLLTSKYFLDKDVIYEDEFLRVCGNHNSKSTTCIVAFAGAAEALGGMEIEGVNFADTEFENASLFIVVDKKKSWSNYINTKVLKKTFESFGVFSRVVAVGTSMGGTNALILGPLLNAETIITFSPQYSVFPEYIPELIKFFRRVNRRSKVLNYIDNIKNWRHKSLSDIKNHATHEFIFFGDAFHDLPQCKSFLENPIKGRRCIPIKKIGHACAPDLEKRGVLASLIKSCLDGAEKSQCISLLNEAGLETYEELPSEVASAAPVKKIIQYLI